MNLTNWQMSLEQSGLDLWSKVIKFLPNVFGALLIIFIGYFLSKTLEVVLEKVLSKLKFNTFCDKLGIHDVLEKGGVKYKFTQIIGFLVFWMFMLTFLISAADSLNLEQVSVTLDAFIMYLPNVLGASLILVLGLMLAQYVSGTLEEKSQNFGEEYSKILSNVSRIILIVFVTILAVSQLQIETDLINNSLQILLISCGTVIALSLGLGSRGFTKNILSGVFAKLQYSIGSTITVNGRSGKLMEIGAINTILQDEKGHRIHIPNSNLVDLEVNEKNNDAIRFEPKKRVSF